jgi:predicted RNA-binding protein with TRAM domain
MDKRWIAVVVGVAFLVGLFLVVRPRDDAEGPAAIPPGVSPTDQPGVGEVTTEPPPTTPTPEGLELEVEVEDGDVRGPGTATVSLGDEVVLVVEADVSDEVHVHGYDLMDDVAPDEPARITFDADTAGIFEIELEEAGLLLVRLKVEP